MTTGYRDLRDWIEILRKQDEIAEIRGASADLEIGALIEMACRDSENFPPALLFSDIPGYPADWRVLGALFSSPSRLGLTLGLSGDDISGKQKMVAACRKKLATINTIPPVMVDTGPVAENVLEGSAIDLLKFPSPRHHELDGGRYIGTANCVITQDPDDGWVNLGTYRCMVLGPDKYGLHMSPGRHGGIMRSKYFARKEPMPIVLAIGVDPALWLSSNGEVPFGISEYDYAGGLKQQPIEVMRGPRTGLPIPARAEIVIEGMCYPGDLEPEGPFGEWAGYYANRGLLQVPENVVRVVSVLHRNQPILTVAHPARPKNDSSFSEATFRSSTMWDEMEKAGVTGIQGVWCHEVGGARLFNVISIKQQFAGHSRQAAMIASQCRSGAYIGRYTVVVDEDIDPSNLGDVIWAISTRTNPDRAIEVIRWTRSSSADPAVSPDLKEEDHHSTAFYTSKAMIDACWPYEWRKRAYPIAQISDELRSKMSAKFSGVLAKIVR